MNLPLSRSLGISSQSKVLSKELFKGIVCVETVEGKSDVRKLIKVELQLLKKEDGWCLIDEEESLYYISSVIFLVPMKRNSSREFLVFLQWLTDNCTVAEEQLVELRGKRSEKATECCNEATQNRGEPCTFPSTERYCYGWN